MACQSIWQTRLCMGAVWSAFRRVPGPCSRYYAEVAKYMNLKEALESLPKGRNNNGYPVISDLVSGVLEEDEDPENRIQHIPHYQAPEMYHSGPWNGKVDVFSFSAIMYELITKKRVFQETDPKRIQEQCECGERLSIRDSPSFEKYHPVVIDIIEKGLSVNPEERYSFEEIYEKMRQVDFMVRKDSRASDHTLELVRSDGMTRDPGGCLLI